MERWHGPVLAWLALAAYLLPVPAFAQATKAGTVTTLEGNVTAVRPIVAQPVSLKFKDDVFLQDRVVTGIGAPFHTNLRGAPLRPAGPLKAKESLSANPTTSSKGTFTPEQVATIVQGLQPQRTREGGSPSQSPARLEAVNTAAALLGVLTGTEAGQEQVALLTAPPAPATTTPPDLGPKVNVTMVGDLTSGGRVTPLPTEPSGAAMPRTVTITAPTAVSSSLLT